MQFNSSDPSKQSYVRSHFFPGTHLPSLQCIEPDGQSVGAVGEDLFYEYTDIWVKLKAAGTSTINYKAYNVQKFKYLIQFILIGVLFVLFNNLSYLYGGEVLLNGICLMSNS